MTLTNSGITPEQIDKLYRSLFVNTVGFFHAIRDLVRQYASKVAQPAAQESGEATAEEGGRDKSIKHNSKGSLISAIWRVYAVLMEFAYANDYKTQVMSVLDESQRMLNEKEVQFQNMLGIEEEKQARARSHVSYLEASLQSTKLALGEKETQYERLRADWLQNKEVHEQEVSLRMKFEDRMNHLHALNRSFNDLATRNDKTIREQGVEIEKLDAERRRALEQL